MANHLGRMVARLGKRTILRSLAGLASVLILYGIFGFFILPGMVKSKAEQLVFEKLHRSLFIEKVEVNPFALTFKLYGATVMEPDKSALFASFDQLDLNISMASLFRFAPVVQEVRLSRPYVHLIRVAGNRYNIDDIVELALQPKPDKEPARFSVYNIQIDGGRIEFDDLPKKARHVVDELKLGIPFASSLPSQTDIFVEPLLSAKVNGTPLLIKGKAHPFTEQRDATVDLQLDGINLPHYVEYLPFKPRFRLPEGKLNLDLTINFVQPKDQPPAVVVEGSVSLKSVRVTELDGTPMVRLPEMVASAVNANLSSGQHRIGRIELTRPEVHVVKERSGMLNLLRLAPEADPKTAPKAEAKPEKTGTSSSIRLVLDQIVIKDAVAKYADQQAARSMSATADKFDLTVNKSVLDLGKREFTVEQIESASALLAVIQGRREEAKLIAGPVAAAVKKKSAEPEFAFRIAKLAISDWSLRLEDRGQPKPAITLASPLSLTLADVSNQPGHQGTLDVRATVNQTGHLSAKGSIGIAPVQANLALDLKEVDILALQPYFSDQINLTLRRASVSSQGTLQVGQGSDGALKGGFKGNMSVGDLVAVDRVSGNEFLRWKRLAFSGVTAQLAPLSLSVNQVALSDFFARVIISREGRINLQDIMQNRPGERISLTEEDGGTSNKTKTETKAPVADSSAPAAKVPPVRIGKLLMQNGRVRFTDNFIQPNYSATLAGLAGSISDLSSDASTAAEIDVRGQVSGAPLTIAGQVNPLSGNLFMDVQASVKGVELAPLSAYSGKYVGYGIEKGKLSFDVAYHIENREMTAQNRLILDQLVFGDKIDSPTATTLPVQLAVALLKDRNGVIDINLPISGSLNDPEFSIGGIIVRVFVNLITKAVTAPFSLLGSMFGGGEELSWLEFDPGSRVLSDAGKAKLESLAKALADRPALKLEITGRIDPVADSEGLARAGIQRKVRALKMRDLEKKGAPADPARVVVPPADYPGLLERVYKDESFSKPRNMIGLQKSLPVAEMERLMLANYTVSQDDLISLANQRAQRVKEWLVQSGQVPADRIFILVGKSGSEHKSAKASRVDFSLR